MLANSCVGINNVSPQVQLDILGLASVVTCQFKSSKTGCDAISYIHYGATGDWYIRSSNNALAGGTVYIQDDTNGCRVSNR